MGDEPQFEKLEAGIEKLSAAVSSLTVNVATQTVTLQGIKELYDLEIRNIKDDIRELKDAKVKQEEKVQDHELYIAETEGKLKAITTMLKAGWTVIGANVLGFLLFLGEMYAQWKGVK